MTWKIKFYDGVLQSVLGMPPGIQARIIKLLELIATHGGNLGAPHTKSLGSGLFELRAKSAEGIGRVIFCYTKSSSVFMLIAFVKKSQKLPLKELKQARKRQNEVTLHDS